MTGQPELTLLARSLPIAERKKILSSFKETDLHGHLKELLGRMEPNSLVEITHGTEEHGKDLVMVRKDRFRESVVGIIVKSGDIKGKTKGKIDEIKSQVDQSLTHPIRLKSIPDRTLSVSETWIMIAGNLSKAAHERLELEVKAKGKNIETDFGLDWLVENFTNFYPQVFYEGKVMDFLEEKIFQLENVVDMFNQRGKTLSECFVEPLITVIDVPEKSDEESLDVIIEKERFPFSQLNTILHPRSKKILFGEPGVGKSVALAKFVLERLQEAWLSSVRKELPEQMKIPIIILANKFIEIDSCEALIQQYIYPHVEIYDRIKVTTIIIDGLDEVLSDKRKELLEKAKGFSEQLNCPLLISTRKTDLFKDPPIEFGSYELLPFDFNQAIKLYEKLTIDVEILYTLRKGLESIIFKVPLTPLILFLLLKIVEYRREVPASITELYDQFSDIVLGRYDFEKGIRVIFEHHIKKRFLAELAFKEFLEKKRLEMPEEEFNAFLTNYANLYRWNEKLLRVFIGEIGRAGILNFKEKVVSFRHVSFLDYCGAFYIWGNKEKFTNLEDFIVKIYFDDFWEDVAFFYIGLQREIDLSLLNKLFEFAEGDPKTFIDKFLTGRLLQAGWHSTSDTLYQGIQKAITYAPIIRKETENILEKSEKTIPKIYFDFLVMLLSNYSFGSRILLRVASDLLDALARKPSYQNAYMMLSLLWAIQRFLGKENIQNSINNILGVIDKISEPNIEEKARIFALLMIIGEEDEKLSKMLKRRVIQVFKRYPGIQHRLLGAPKRERLRGKRK